jgi:hypothetical protein
MSGLATTGGTVTITPRWVCGVTRSGYHNGAGCHPGDPHPEEGWHCGYRWELSLPAPDDTTPLTMSITPVPGADDSTTEG